MGMGIGMALFEETLYDNRSGAPANSNLADYVVATNADAPNVEVHFLNDPEKALNELGARCVGEIGLAGSPRRFPERCTTRPTSGSGLCRSRSRTLLCDALRRNERSSRLDRLF